MNDKKSCANCSTAPFCGDVAWTCKSCPRWQRDPSLFLDIPPTEPGCYHYKYKLDDEPDMVRLETGRMLSSMGSNIRVSIDKIEGYFQGPLAPKG